MSVDISKDVKAFQKMLNHVEVYENYNKCPFGLLKNKQAYKVFEKCLEVFEKYSKRFLKSEHPILDTVYTTIWPPRLNSVQQVYKAIT